MNGDARHGPETDDQSLGQDEGPKRAGRRSFAALEQIGATALGSVGPVLKSASEMARIQAQVVSGGHLPYDAFGARTVMNDASLGRVGVPSIAQDLARSSLSTSKLVADVAGAQKLMLGGAFPAAPASTGALGGFAGGLAFGATNKLIEQWRDQLAIGKKTVQLEVAGSMSKLIADTNLEFLASSDLPRSPNRGIPRGRAPASPESTDDPPPRIDLVIDSTGGLDTPFHGDARDRAGGGRGSAT